MTYTATYESTDLFDMIIDLIGTIFAALVDNSALLVGLIIIGLVVYLARDLIGSVFGILFKFGKK